MAGGRLNRPGHVAGSGVAALTIAHATALPLPAAAILTAGAFLAAMLPDLDNRRWWRTADKYVPDEVLGYGGPLNHRGLLHWWGLPAIAYAATMGLDAPWWALTAIHGLIVGVAAHLVLDAVWGEPGIPLAPWWWHVGLGLRNDSGLASAATFALPLVGLWLAFTVAAGFPADPRWLL